MIEVRKTIGQKLKPAGLSWVARVGVALLLFSGRAAAQDSHPFMIVRGDQYPALRERAAQEPWKAMKAQAIADCNKAAYPAAPGPELSKAYTMASIMGACALAYILDPPGKAAHKDKILTTAAYWDDLWANKADPNGRNDDYGWRVGGSAALFNSVLALDILHDELTDAERGGVEAKLKRTADAYSGGADAYTTAGYGMLAIYFGDRARIDRAKSDWRSQYLGHLSEDGVFNDGPGYASASVNYRPAKMDFMHVLEFTGEDKTWYSNRRVIRFFEWLYGGAFAPFGTLPVAFGDTQANGIEYPGPSSFSAYRFSEKAARQAAWFIGDRTPRGQLLFYVLMNRQLPAPEKPKSDVWPDGCAAFWEDNPSARSLMGVLWNAKSSTGGGHAHKDVNALHLSAYGEHVLRNVGYAAWGVGELGFSWAYIHDTAVANNTVLINDADHVLKTGGGITEWFTAGEFDYASGDSGGALSNGKHRRNFVFVHPQDGGNGYWVLIDEVTVNTAGNPVNVALHPNSSDPPTVSADQEYRFRVSPYSLSGHDVFLSVFLGTPPAAATVKDGVLVLKGGKSFVGKYLYSTYDTAGGTRRNVVTVLFPHDDAPAKGSFDRISGNGYSGASVSQGGGITDVALESSGVGEVTHDGVSFRGLATLYRKSDGKLGFYFVRQGRLFDDGVTPRQGFSAEAAVSIYLKGKTGKLVSSGTDVTFFYPGISGVLMNGASLPVKDSGAGWLKAGVASGVHELELQVGGEIQLGATAVADRTQGEAPLAVQFTGVAVGGKPPYSFAWDFGDGASSNEQNPSHTYGAVGSYAAALTVTDQAGTTAKDSLDISVLEAGWTVFSPIPYFGDSASYQTKTPSRWEVSEDEGDRRFFLKTSDYESDGDKLGEVALVKGHSYADFKIRLKAKSAEDPAAISSADYCVVFGYQDAENYYYAMYHAKDSVLFRVSGGVRTQVGEIYTRAPTTFERYHSIELQRSGGRITLSFDGQAEVVAEDTTFGTGGIGVGSYNDSVYLDDLEVVADCPAGFADCNGDPRDGCEAELAADGDNCGGCGKKCGGGVVCQGGECCPPGSAAGDGCLEVVGTGCGCGAFGAPGSIAALVFVVLWASSLRRRENSRRAHGGAGERGAAPNNNGGLWGQA